MPVSVVLQYSFCPPFSSAPAAFVQPAPTARAALSLISPPIPFNSAGVTAFALCRRVIQPTSSGSPAPAGKWSTSHPFPVLPSGGRSNLRPVTDDDLRQRQNSGAGVGALPSGESVTARISFFSPARCDQIRRAPYMPSITFRPTTSPLCGTRMSPKTGCTPDHCYIP